MSSKESNTLIGVELPFHDLGLQNLLRELGEFHASYYGYEKLIKDIIPYLHPKGNGWLFKDKSNLWLLPN